MCVSDFRRRFVSLLSYKFRTFTSALALNMIQMKDSEKSGKCLSVVTSNLLLIKMNLRHLHYHNESINATCKSVMLVSHSRVE